MKTKILYITLLLVIGGCSKEPINMDKMLNERDGVFYFKDTNKLYSGYYYNNDINGVIKNQGLIENGKLRNQLVFNKSGYNLMTRFYENGNKENEHFLIHVPVF